MSTSTATRYVALLGHPVAHSLSPRMQNAAFAARGLDWLYVALDVPPERLEEAVHGLDALGFAGANVTAPHKLAVAKIVGADVPSVNTLVGTKGFSTDTAILDGLDTERPVILGDGGAAAAFRHALPHARVFSRRGEWPPDAGDADLVVNATPVRDEVLVELRAGPDARRPAVPAHGDGRGGGGGRGARPRRPRGARRAGRGVLRALDGRACAGCRHAAAH